MNETPLSNLPIVILVKVVANLNKNLGYLFKLLFENSGKYDFEISF